MAITDKEFQQIKSTIKDFIKEEMVSEEKFDVKHTFEEQLPYLEEKEIRFDLWVYSLLKFQRNMVV